MGNYNPNLVYINQIQKTFFCVYKADKQPICVPTRPGRDVKICLKYLPCVLRKYLFRFGRSQLSRASFIYKLVSHRSVAINQSFSPLRKLNFHFLSHWMGYDRGDSFPFNFEPNGIPFGTENRKENCHPNYIPFKVKGNANLVFSV